MSDSPLRFHRAEFDGEIVALDHCTWCSRGLDAGHFYRANTSAICGVCADRAKAVMPRNDRKVFWRTVAWGAVACMGVALVLLLLDRAALRYDFVTVSAFAAIGAGYLIGKVMRRASRGAGGRKYQVMVALFIYTSVTVAWSATIMGTDGIPLWAYPLLALAPIAQIFMGHFDEGLLVLMVAGIGIRWAWGMLAAWPLKITGPESVIATKPRQQATS